MVNDNASADVTDDICQADDLQSCSGREGQPLVNDNVDVWRSFNNLAART